MNQPLRRLSQGAKARVRRRLIESLKGGPRTQQANRRFAELVRDLAAFAADLSASAVPRHELAVQTVVTFQARVADAEANAGRALDRSLGRRAWHADAPVVEALTEVAQQLVGLNDALALRAATAVLEVLPDDETARAAHDKLTTPAPAGEEAWRVSARRRTRDTRIAVAMKELADSGAAPVAVADLVSSYHGDPAATTPYLPALRSAVAHELAAGAPVTALRGVLDATVAEMGAGMWEKGARWSGEPPAVRTVNMSGLREYFAGKRVCLVANSAELLERELGAEIDGYDVVVRFNAFALDPVHTGSRTDVHATVHQHDLNWDVPVDIRLVLDGAPAQVWVGAMVKRLRPDAQKWVGDESVRWPRGAIMPHDLRASVPAPTTGLTMIMVLDYLDVSSAIDLFGFNFHAGEPYRRADATQLSGAEAHSHAAERDWVLARAVSTAPGKIALR